MRYRITLRTTGTAQLLPLAHQAQLSAWVFEALHRANPAYADFLRTQGYSSNETASQSFRFFTFSALQIAHYKPVPEANAFLLFSEEAQIEVSFLSDEASVYFARGLAANPLLRLGQDGLQVIFKVTRIEGLAQPVFQSRELYRTSSAVVVSATKWQNGRLQTMALAPTDAEYGPAVVKNLLRKYHALTGRHLPQAGIQFHCLSKPKKTTAGNTPQGHHYDFALTAPAELQRMALLAGIGDNNMLGHGALQQLPATYGHMQQALQDLKPRPAPVARERSIAPRLAAAA
jgi:CRISPR-associated endoribonuclease Cas6